MKPDFGLHDQERQSHIRAGRAVAEVSPDGGHVADLNASQASGRLHEHREVFLEFRIMEDIADRRQSSYSGDLAGIDTVESRDGAERYERLRMDFPVFDTHHHVCSPGYEQGVRCFSFQFPDLIERLRLVVCEMFHATTLRSLSEAISEEDRPISARMVSVCSP